MSKCLSIKVGAKILAILLALEVLLDTKEEPRPFVAHDTRRYRSMQLINSDAMPGCQMIHLSPENSSHTAGNCSYDQDVIGSGHISAEIVHVIRIYCTQGHTKSVRMLAVRAASMPS